MSIYIALILFILCLSGIISCLKINMEKKKNLFLFVAFIAIFLIYILRDSSVGRDIPGYKEMYLESAKHAWFDFEYVYFENGYILLEKLCTSLNLSFQSFLVVVYSMVLFPIYRFIKKYSTNYLMSTMIYICYIFFEFNMSGMRQAIASSIVLLGYMFLLEVKKSPLFVYIFCIVIASFFHTGALAGLLILPFMHMENYKTFSICGLLAFIFTIISRSKILSFIKYITKKGSMDVNVDLYIGLNFIMMFLLSLVFVYGAYVLSNKIKLINKKGNNEYMIKNIEFVNKQYVMNTKCFIVSILALFIFGSDSTARSAMILSQVMLVQLPNSIKIIFSKDSWNLINIMIIFFLVCFFFSNTLLSNNLDIVPYKFWWQ